MAVRRNNKLKPFCFNVSRKASLPILALMRKCTAYRVMATVATSGMSSVINTSNR